MYVHTLTPPFSPSPLVGNCTSFLIDLALELLILYEHEYEIYGDIQAATNCFKIDAYQQGNKWQRVHFIYKLVPLSLPTARYCLCVI